MLKTNIMKNNAETMSTFANAVEYSRLAMYVTSVNDSIARKEKSLENSDSMSESKIAAIKEEIEELRKESAKATENRDNLQADYDKVYAAMTEKNKDHFGNDPKSVKVVLNILATADAPGLIKYAFDKELDGEALYNALEAVHASGKYSDEGVVSLTKDVKEAYKSAKNELERVIKTTFSLPFESEYTNKTRVKLDSEDIALLHECYVKGFSNKYDKAKDGSLTFKNRELSTVVRVKTKKNGEKEYDYKGLYQVIGNICIKHYSAE